jgi:TRAP-type C4-dicarboxylate transport system permease small subunit
MGQWVDRLIRWGLALCMGAMTCIVFISVVFRYVLNSPLTWTEELASLLFAWVTFVGAYVGFRSRSHISIDTLVIFLPSAARQWVARFVDVCVLLLLALFLWEGISLTMTTWSLEYPAMEISRGYLYLAIPVGAVLMAFGMFENWRKSQVAGQEEHP